MAKRKVRKFAEGGFTPEQEAWLGGADRTDPYILARMRSAVPDAPIRKDDSPSGTSGYGEQNEMPSSAPVTKTVTQSKVSVTKPKSSWDDNSPIPAIPDAPRKVETPAENKARMEALTKKQALIDVAPEDYVTPGGLLKGMLKKVIGNSAKSALKTYTAKELAEMAPKMIGRESLKLGMKKGGSVKKMSSGGKVKSASARADGCAIRGKTRA